MSFCFRYLVRRCEGIHGEFVGWPFANGTEEPFTGELATFVENAERCFFFTGHPFCFIIY